MLLTLWTYHYSVSDFHLRVGGAQLVSVRWRMVSGSAASYIFFVSSDYHPHLLIEEITIDIILPETFHPPKKDTFK